MWTYRIIQVDILGDVRYRIQYRPKWLPLWWKTHRRPWPWDTEARDYFDIEEAKDCVAAFERGDARRRPKVTATYKL